MMTWLDHTEIFMTCFFNGRKIGLKELLFLHFALCVLDAALNLNVSERSHCYARQTMYTVIIILMVGFTHHQ